MKMAVIYWSQTGNTEAMANAIAEGAKAGGADARVFTVSDISVVDALQYDALALGCPSMGNEVLEESEFEPFYNELEKGLADKKVALFGSYDWGDGEWMRNWQDAVKAAGSSLYNDEGLIINLTPDDNGIATCEAFGKGFAAFK